MLQTQHTPIRKQRGKHPILDYISITESGCWEFQGSRTPTGYGVAWDGTKHTSAHRVSYELLVGPIPDGLEIDHNCRNRACCNPAHLEPVTHLENLRRRPRSSQRHPGNTTNHPSRRKTHCIRGHEFSTENTITYTGGKRQCRTCHTEAQKRRRALQ
jgi:hypothetical protein